MEHMINLEQFANGALTEKINTEVEKVLNNIYDPNTDAKKKRKVSVNITFKPNESRNLAQISIETKTSLAPVIPTETNIIIDKDLKSGKVMAAEIGNQAAGQIKMDLGDEPMPEDGNIIDLKKVNNK